MPKLKSVYICQSCEYISPQWVGQCSNCGEWNTFVETVQESTSKSSNSLRSSSGAVKTPQRLADVSINETKRVPTGVNEFDRVLGGGFVLGQVVLIAGTPGVGKSTILTQVARAMQNVNIAYVCGEESVGQIKVRAERMGYKAENLYMISETNIENVVASISQLHQTVKLGLVIVDSIQTQYSEDLTGLPGSVGQVRGSAGKIISVAKDLKVPAIIVGHVTKEGTIAGPMVLEHMVDTVLYLEGDSQHMFRVLKTTKNRFGPVSEVGIFEMRDSGLVEVANPSELFLEKGEELSSGTCTTVVMEGYRPILFEIQALTVKTAFGYPRRTTSGFNLNRLQVLIAILEKRCGLNLSGHDVYVSVSGGYKVSEYSVDLAVCLAIASSLKDKPLAKGVVAFGECSLSGRIRSVLQQERRAKEASKLGYKTIYSSDTVSSLKQAVFKSLS